MKELFQKLSNFFNSSKEERMVNVDVPKAATVPPLETGTNVANKGNEAGTEAPEPTPKITTESTKALVADSKGIAESAFASELENNPIFTPVTIPGGEKVSVPTDDIESATSGLIVEAENEAVAQADDQPAPSMIEFGQPVIGDTTEGTAVAQAKPKPSAPLAAILKNPPE